MGKRKLLRMYDIIGVGSLTANHFVDSISGLETGDTLTMAIHSPGGILSEGLAIYNELKLLAAKGVIIESIAMGDTSSAATLPFLAADKDKRYVTKGATFLVHRPSAYICGFSDDMGNKAEHLENLTKEIVDIYSKETGIDREKIINIMSGDGTLYTSDDFINDGWAGGYADFEKMKFDEEEKKKNTISSYYNELFMQRKNAIAMSKTMEKEKNKENTFTQQDIDAARMEGARGEIKRRNDFHEICPLGYEDEMANMLQDPMKTVSDFSLHIAKMEKASRERAAAEMTSKSLDAPKIPPVADMSVSGESVETKGTEEYARQWDNNKSIHAAFFHKKENYISYMIKKGEK